MNKTILIHDISFWQDRNDTPRKVDFAKMKASGAQGVIVRAGQGNFIDEDFVDFYTASKGILPRGVYWFYDSRVAPLSQARLFADTINQRGLPEMEAWADYEETYGGSYSGWRSFAVFLAEVERLLPTARIGIYTGYYYWLAHCPSLSLNPASFRWFARFPLWLAWYTNNDSIVKVPSPWTSTLLWQFSSHGDGLAAGVESLNIDCSYFQGSQADFNARYGTTTPVPPPTPTPVPPPSVPLVVGPGYYRVKHDYEKAVKSPRSTGWKKGQKLRGLPETCRLNGGKGSVNMSAAWAKYIQSINSPNGYRYVQKLQSGWVNSGPFPHVEELTFGGNIVEVTAIEGQKAYVKTYFNNEKPPAVKGPNTLVQRFSVVYNDGSVEMATPVGNVFIVLIANPGERLWIDMANLVKV